MIIKFSTIGVSMSSSSSSEMTITSSQFQFTNLDRKTNWNWSIAAIWLEKVVTPLIDPAIKGFTAAPAVLKPERLKVDKTRYE
nr:hypothetical protein [Tanacetum cinerariifolium]